MALPRAAYLHKAPAPRMRRQHLQNNLLGTRNTHLKCNFRNLSRRDEQVEKPSATQFELEFYFLLFMTSCFYLQQDVKSLWINLFLF